MRVDFSKLKVFEKFSTNSSTGDYEHSIDFGADGDVDYISYQSDTNNDGFYDQIATDANIGNKLTWSP